MDNIIWITLHDLITNNKNFFIKIKNKYINLMSELSIAVDINDNLFNNNIDFIHKIGIILVGYVDQIENDNFNFVCSGTVIIEPKIIRQGMNVGHIEDIVVSNLYRGKGISQILLNKLKEYCCKNNCYKIILDCDESVINVYEKNGFTIKGYQLGYYY